MRCSSKCTFATHALHLDHRYVRLVGTHCGVQLDSKTFEVFSPSLRSALSLSAADRRWIDFITEVVNDTWDEGKQ